LAFVAPVALTATVGPALAASERVAFSTAQRPFLDAMLGVSGAPLPDGCVADRLTIEPARVTAEYRCGGKTTRPELRPQGDAKDVPERTKHFDLLRGPGEPAPGSLVRAVARRVRAREALWFWTGVDESAVPTAPPAPDGEGDVREAVASPAPAAATDGGDVRE